MFHFLGVRSRHSLAISMSDVGGGGPKVLRPDGTNGETVNSAKEFEPLFPADPNPMKANEFGL
jgi:hypothetical protein